MDTLREKIARELRAREWLNLSQGQALQIADSVLAIPEMEALRLKVIKTMVVRK